MAQIYIVELAENERVFTAKDGESVRSQKCVLRDLEGQKYASRWVAEYIGPVELQNLVGKPIATTIAQRYVEDPVSGVKFTKFQFREVIPLAVNTEMLNC